LIHGGSEIAFRPETINIMANMMGTATTPLITAVQ